MDRILQGKVRSLGVILAEASSVKITVVWNVTHEAVFQANLRLQNTKLLKNIRFLEDPPPCRNFKGISAIVFSVWRSGFFTPLSYLSLSLVTMSDKHSIIHTSITNCSDVTVMDLHWNARRNVLFM